jgi:predicted PurR-regulated permease PerM
MIAAFVTLITIVTLVVTVVVIQLVECVKVIIDETPDFIKSAVTFLEDKKIISKNTVDFVNSIDWKSKIGDIISVVTSGIGNVVDILFKTVT